MAWGAEAGASGSNGFPRAGSMMSAPLPWTDPESWVVSSGMVDLLRKPPEGRRRRAVGAGGQHRLARDRRFGHGVFIFDDRLENFVFKDRAQFVHDLVGVIRVFFVHRRQHAEQVEI